MKNGITNNITQYRNFAIEIKDLSKTYISESGECVHALDSVNINVPEGGFLTLIGPTGCGKTTILNIISGLEKPDSGQVLFTDDLQPGRTIACVFQHYTLFPWRSILRNITFGLQMQGVPGHNRKDSARELLYKVGLSGFERAYPHELSGGMRQRAAIAQALAIRPRLLLMDEPFGALDDPTRRELYKMLIDLWQESRTTIIFVTHNLDEAITLADKVTVLSERPGRVVKEFDVELPRPRNSQSSDFIDMFIKVRKSLVSALS